MKKLFTKFDEFFINIINDRIKNPFLDVFFYRYTFLGGATFITVVTVLMIVLGTDSGFRRLGLDALISQLLVGVVVQSLKKVFARERPYKILESLNTFGINMRDYSFPSGHTAASFSLALIFSINYPYLTIPMFIYAFLIGVSRIYLGVHYPTDVMAGFIIGLIMSTIGHTFAFPMAIDWMRRIYFMING
ncbi:MAG: phosphatase PAP2 family protein [Tissierellia bacterium]|nr:phosphatase PAP2 family protein [Tissierellia bacterium]